MIPMNVLVIGGGCREHIIAKRLHSEGNSVFSVMHNRNPGIEAIASETRIAPVTDAEGIAGFAKSKRIEFVVIGPEDPLQAGVADALLAEGIDCFGPEKEAARIETSKSFTRGLLDKYGIPGNPKHSAFTTAEAAIAFIEDCDFDVVVKPSGLTGGKGVKVVGEQLGTNDDAKEYVRQIFGRGIGGDGGVVVEQRLIGEEFSLQAVSDGKRLLAFPLAQDHKKAFEGDKGPNTGGMGSYSMANGLLPFVDEHDRESAMYIMQRTISAMRQEGVEFRGLLYGGFMLTRDGVKLLEYNARFADPESMNVLSVTRGRLTDVLQSAATGNISGGLTFEKMSTVCRYYVPHGYGEKPVKGSQITVDEKKIEEMGVDLFYGSVNSEAGKLTTTTSRSFALVAKREEPWDASAMIERAGQFIGGLVYTRKDIGTREEIESKRRAGLALHGRTG